MKPVYLLADRKKLMERENSLLAPYAQKCSNSRGRRHPEHTHDLRTDFQRDRDRVVHSRSFRRLEYKTQVFLNGTGDHLRTRLTHTIEVAAIARTLARALLLNEDLAEAISLAHDLGHPPFGHSGERVLHGLMKEHGGFDHNHQSLRIVEELECKYPEFEGLNLTWEVREGLVKHHTMYDQEAHRTEFPFPSMSLEAQIANLSDEVAYYSHDLDDGLGGDLLKDTHLDKIELYHQTVNEIRREYTNLEKDRLRYFTIRGIINKQVQDIIDYSLKLIKRGKLESADHVRQTETTFFQYSPRMAEQAKELREFLFKKLYNHPQVRSANDQAVYLVRDLFEYYLKHPQKLSKPFKKRISVFGKERAVCDYISGMTDRYVLEAHNLIFDSDIDLSMQALK